MDVHERTAYLRIRLPLPVTGRFVVRRKCDWGHGHGREERGARRQSSQPRRDTTRTRSNRPRARVSRARMRTPRPPHPDDQGTEPADRGTRHREGVPAWNMRSLVARGVAAYAPAARLPHYDAQVMTYQEAADDRSRPCTRGADWVDTTAGDHDSNSGDGKALGAWAHRPRMSDVVTSRIPILAPAGPVWSSPISAA